MQFLRCQSVAKVGFEPKILFGSLWKPTPAEQDNWCLIKRFSKIAFVYTRVCRQTLIKLFLFNWHGCTGLISWCRLSVVYEATTDLKSCVTYPHFGGRCHCHALVVAQKISQTTSHWFRRESQTVSAKQQDGARLEVRNIFVSVVTASTSGWGQGRENTCICIAWVQFRPASKMCKAKCKLPIDYYYHLQPMNK